MTGRPDVARRLGALSLVARVGLFNGNEARFMYPTTKKLRHRYLGSYRKEVATPP